MTVGEPTGFANRTEVDAGQLNSTAYYLRAPTKNQSTNKIAPWYATQEQVSPVVTERLTYSGQTYAHTWSASERQKRRALAT